MLTLREFLWLTGCGKTIGSADSVARLPWSVFDGLNTYSVERNSVALAEFEGHEAHDAYVWLRDHADYDGRAGAKAWKGKCSWCDGRLCDGRCSCDEAVDSHNRAEARIAAYCALRDR